MLDVIVLGSGTPNPDPERAGPSVAVADGSSWVLVDCGRAATQRALAAGLDLTALRAVLITHHHSDHLSDLATLAITRWIAGAAGPLPVVAPHGPASEFASRCLAAFADDSFHGQAGRAAGPRPAITVDAFAAGDDIVEILGLDGWIARSVAVHHHPVEPAVGYRVERDGVAVVISGDTAVCDGMRRLADGAQLVVHEALLSRVVSAALLEGNAGARSVGELAHHSRTHTLVLTHLIPAPRNAADEDAFVTEVRDGGFSGQVVVAHDLLRLVAG